MGVCASCLGLRKSSDETQRLLSPTDGYGTYPYSSFPAQSVGNIQLDPADIVHEQEALERIVAHASENLIDILALQQNMVPAGYAGDETRAENFRRLLARTSPPELPDMPKILPSKSITAAERKWLNELSLRAEEAVAQMKTIKGVGKLVVELEVDT